MGSGADLPVWADPPGAGRRPEVGRPVAGRPEVGRPVVGRPVVGRPVVGRPVAGRSPMRDLEGRGGVELMMRLSPMTLIGFQKIRGSRRNGSLLSGSDKCPKQTEGLITPKNFFNGFLAVKGS